MKYVFRFASACALVAAVVLNAHFFFRFFLLRVVRLDFQLAIGQLQTDATVFLVGQDRGTAVSFALLDDPQLHHLVICLISCQADTILLQQCTQ